MFNVHHIVVDRKRSRVRPQVLAGVADNEEEAHKTIQFLISQFPSRGLEASSGRSWARDPAEPGVIHYFWCEDEREQTA